MTTRTHSPGSKPAGSRDRAAVRPDFSVAGLVGAELAAALHTLHRVAQTLGDEGRLSGEEAAELARALDQADQLARQSQQLARLSEGLLRQSHERVSLDQMVEAALRDRQQTIDARGIMVQQSIRPVEIVVDPGLLFNLVETALDWAIERGRHVAVTLAINDWPEHGLLSITADLGDAEATGRTGGISPTLRWILLEQIARAMGVTLATAPTERGCGLRLEFARTVKHLEGLTALEIESNSADSALGPETKALAGLRVLLVTTDPVVRAEVEKACQSLGLRPDTVGSSSEAVRSVERDPPHMAIVDQRLRDREFDALVQDIRRLDANFGFLEIIDDATAPEVSGWSGDGMTRVRRDALRTHLPAMLTLELAKSF